MTGQPPVAPLKMPGMTPRLGTVPAIANKTELPEIYTADPIDARPSICLIGDSGTGKTEQLKRLIAHLNTKGLATIVVAAESKQQILAMLRPLVLPINAPMRVGTTVRPPTPTEKYNRLLRFRDDLKEGKFREHGGRKVGAIAFDGLMEVGDIVKAHRMSPGVMPIDRDGSQNTWAAFDRIGLDLIDLMASFKEAASDSGKAYGIEPITIAATCGEMLHKSGKFIPILPGNQAPDKLPYQFELILRLATEVTDGGVQYVAHTVNGETPYPNMGRWTAKAPGGLFDEKIVNPNLGEIYERLVGYYRGENPTENKGA